MLCVCVGKQQRRFLELGELLLVALAAGHLEHVEAHGLAERSALANGHNVAVLHVSRIIHENEEKDTKCK